MLLISYKTLWTNLTINYPCNIPNYAFGQPSLHKCNLPYNDE